MRPPRYSESAISRLTSCVCQVLQNRSVIFPTECLPVGLDRALPWQSSGVVASPSISVPACRRLMDLWLPSFPCQQRLQNRLGELVRLGVFGERHDAYRTVRGQPVRYNCSNPASGNLAWVVYPAFGPCSLSFLSLGVTVRQYHGLSAFCRTPESLTRFGTAWSRRPSRPSRSAIHGRDSGARYPHQAYPPVRGLAWPEFHKDPFDRKTSSSPATAHSWSGNEVNLDR
jgi:hypothetical protein